MKNILTVLEESQFATGIDISYYNDKFDIDIATEPDVLEILDFVILRAGFGSKSGSAYKDTKFDIFYSELEEHPLPLRGAYWYFSSNVNWKIQADKFISILKDKDIDFIVLDIEKYYNKKSEDFAYNAMNWLEYITETFKNKRILIYSNKYIYRDWIRIFTPKCDNYPYWQAQYWWSTWKVSNSLLARFMIFLQGVFTSGNIDPSLPSSREGRWDIWQVGDKTNLAKSLGVGGTNLDINVTNKTKEEFIEWIGVPSRWELPIIDPIEDPIKPIISDPEITVKRDGNDIHIHIYIGEE